MLKLPLMIFSTIWKSSSRDILVRNDEPSPVIGALGSPKESPKGALCFRNQVFSGGFSRIVRLNTVQLFLNVNDSPHFLRGRSEFFKVNISKLFRKVLVASPALFFFGLFCLQTECCRGVLSFYLPTHC